MVKCPWCSKSVENYEKHLFTEHYEKKGDKTVGPYPAGVPK